MVVQRHREIMETADVKACFKRNTQIKVALKALSLLPAGGKAGARSSGATQQWLALPEWSLGNKAQCPHLLSRSKLCVVEHLKRIKGAA